MAKNTETVKSEKKNKDVDKYIKETVDREVKTAVENAEKKLIKHKNIVIIKRDIIIVVLLLLYIYLVYNLYHSNYFDKFFKNSSENKVVESIESTRELQSNEPIESVEEDNNLIDEYKYLLDNIYISEESDYVDNFYNGTLDNKTKLYLAVNYLDLDLIGDEDLNYVDGEDLESAYNELFSEDVDFESFKYNNCNFNYLKKKNLFILDDKISRTTNIKREILDVKQDNDEITIITSEGVVIDKVVYNITNKKAVSDKYREGDLEKHKDKLNTMQYVFELNDDKYELKFIGVYSEGKEENNFS